MFNGCTAQRHSETPAHALSEISPWHHNAELYKERCQKHFSVLIPTYEHFRTVTTGGILPTSSARCRTAFACPLFYAARRLRFSPGQDMLQVVTARTDDPQHNFTMMRLLRDSNASNTNDTAENALELQSIWIPNHVVPAVSELLVNFNTYSS